MRGAALVEWGEGCACGGGASSPLSNPAGPSPVGAIAALYDELASALVIGELAHRLGVPDGQTLVNDVAAFVASRVPVEVGGVWSVVRPVASAAWNAVETRAAALWRTLGKTPTSLLAIGGGVLLASQYLGGQAAAQLEDISLRASLLQDVIMSIPPEARAKALREAGLGDGAGMSAWGWAAVAVAVLGGVYLWRQATGKGR